MEREQIENEKTEKSPRVKAAELYFPVDAQSHKAICCRDKRKPLQNAYTRKNQGKSRQDRAGKKEKKDF